MRIIAGRLKGRRLPAVKDPGVRPTSDRVRESMFSTLESMGLLEGVRVLDLFAGTGSLGIESLSRGASYCSFVERQRNVASTLAQAIADFSLTECTAIHCMTAERYLSKHDGEGYQLLFLDPPYHEYQAVSVLQTLLRSSVIRSGSWVVYESASPLELHDGLLTVDGCRLLLALEKDKTYGDTVVSFLRVNSV